VPDLKLTRSEPERDIRGIFRVHQPGCRYRAADGESPQIANRQERDGSFSLPNILHRYGSPDRIGAR
jgi:hypothetical protein